MLADRSASFTLAKSGSNNEAELQALAHSAITLPMLKSVRTVQSIQEQKYTSITMKKIAISILSTALLLSCTSEVKAQSLQVAQNQTLQDSWADAPGFASFTWARDEDGREIYSSAVYLSLSGNQLSIYNTYNAAPLGHLARCGGLGCDLGRGQLLANLEVVKQNRNLFTVTSTSDKVSFLQGAQCRIDESYLQVFECFSLRGPNSEMPSVFRFSPGT